MSLNEAFILFKQAIAKKYNPSQEVKTKYDIRQKNSSIEFETRFGLKNSISKMEFERVYNKLISHGFVKVSEQYHLKIITDNATRLRSEINDLSSIREYCKTNILPDNTEHIIKENIDRYIDNTDFNFRISIQKEYKYDNADPDIADLYKNWKSIEKSYRYMTRIKLQHPDKKALCVDLSIVKSAKSRDGALLKEQDFSMSKLFSTNDEYEIEIEINDLRYLLKEKKSIELKYNKLKEDMKNTIKYVAAGFQSSNFPISLTEQKTVFRDYNTCSGNKVTDVVVPSMFIGPSSLTLQKMNLSDDPENLNPSVLNNFCVTDKADGDRKLLIISMSGRVYYMTMNMNVQYTGAICMDTKMYGTIIDGEHILYDKNKRYINLYAAFDIYFISKKDIRKFPFISQTECRYVILNQIMSTMKFKFESDTEQPSFVVKKFYASTKTETIYDCCAKLFKSIEAHSYPYETDGIIFTSNVLGVGMETKDDTIKNKKYTWKHSFKWKPPEFNTIDFLIKVKRIGAQDDIEYINEGGNVQPYKILNLYVGYNEKKDGHLNPQQLMFEGITSRGGESVYSPVLFTPTSPIDQLAHICYIPLKNDSSGEMKMFTENNEAIDSDIVVEFKYVKNDDRRMSWVPLRIRYDKTADYKKKKSFGNAYHVANSNWHTIHNPVTKEMLTSYTEISMDDENDDVYYNTDESKSKTHKMKTFHNMGVKRLIIDKVCKPGNTLVDFAVGRGGDLYKWNANKLKFVLGIDISKDNIHNPKGGVCARYLGLKKKWSNLIDALFIHGDTSKIILNGDFAKDDDKQEETNSKFVIDQVMGIGKPSAIHGPYISKLFGISSDLFDIGSIQFAIHYMFKDIFTLHNFLKNCSDMIKVGGYLIGTCYDGESVFNKLEPFPDGESSSLYIKESKVWSIKKMYNNEEFTKENCLGYTVGVYQDSINKEFEEYLVHFPYFIEMMGNYGFMPHSPVKDLEPIDTFESIYKKGGFVMSPEEQQISFLNKYFMFKKVRSVATTQIHDQFTRGEEVSYTIGKPVKLNKKIVLKK